MSTDGASVVRTSGFVGVRSAGSVAIFGAQGCSECCDTPTGRCFPNPGWDREYHDDFNVEKEQPQLIAEGWEFGTDTGYWATHDGVMRRFDGHLGIQPARRHAYFDYFGPDTRISFQTTIDISRDPGGAERRRYFQVGLFMHSSWGGNSPRPAYIDNVGQPPNALYRIS